MPEAGVDWDGVLFWSSAKIALDWAGRNYLLQREVVLQPGPQISRGLFDKTGFLGARAMRQTEEWLDFIVPGSARRFEIEWKGKLSFGEAAVHRARNSIIHDEMKRFRARDLRRLYDVVVAHCQSSEPIEDRHRFRIAEAIILDFLGGPEDSDPTPGVYVCQDPENRASIYLGSTHDLRDRLEKHPARHSGGLRAVRAWTVHNLDVAEALEDSLHHKLKTSGLVKETPTEASEGHYRLAPGCDGLEILDVWVNTDYRAFTRATLGWLL